MSERRVKLNGITLGPDSPLIRQPKLPVEVVAGPEFAVQAALVELLIGPARGDRQPGAGLTGRIPSLALLYAIPNGTSASSKTAAGKRKAEGALKGIPDLHWPVSRGPFIGLSLDAKRPGVKSARPEQRAIHAALRAEGHCVVVFNDVQHGLDVVLRYHDLGRFLPGHDTFTYEAHEAFVKLGTPR